MRLQGCGNSTSRGMIAIAGNGSIKETHLVYYVFEKKEVAVIWILQRFKGDPVYHRCCINPRYKLLYIVAYTLWCSIDDLAGLQYNGCSLTCPEFLIYKVWKSHHKLLVGLVINHADTMGPGNCTSSTRTWCFWLKLKACCWKVVIHLSLLKKSVTWFKAVAGISWFVHLCWASWTQYDLEGLSLTQDFRSVPHKFTRDPALRKLWFAFHKMWLFVYSRVTTLYWYL